MLRNCADMSEDGIVINPWGNAFMLTKDLIQLILKVDEEENKS